MYLGCVLNNVKNALQFSLRMRLVFSLAAWLFKLNSLTILTTKSLSSALIGINIHIQTYSPIVCINLRQLLHYKIAKSSITRTGWLKGRMSVSLGHSRRASKTKKAPYSPSSLGLLLLNFQVSFPY